jgi:predicted nucleotidyltransferase
MHALTKVLHKSFCCTYACLIISETAFFGKWYNEKYKSIEMKKEQIKTLLTKHRNSLSDFHVKAVFLFGSVVRGEEKEASDVDLLVEFEPGAHIGLFEFARLQRMLSGILGCDVDIVTPEALHKAMKDRILEEAVHAI